MRKSIALAKCPLWGIAFLAALTFATPAFDWNKAGHMVSGAIAYAEMYEQVEEITSGIV